MANYQFPILKNIQFKAFSELLSVYQFDVRRHSIINDFVSVLSEFFHELEQFAQAGTNTDYTYEQLVDRSTMLLNWLDLLESQFALCLPILSDEDDDKYMFELIAHFRKVYSHPLLASMWLALEVTSAVNNLKNESDFLRYMGATNHFDYKLKTHFKEFIRLFPESISTKALQLFVDSMNEENIENANIEKFIALSSPLFFQLIINGKIDLAVGGLELYHHYLIYFDKLRLHKLNCEAFDRIKMRVAKRYSADNSVYSIGNPLFDAHISLTHHYINNTEKNDISYQKQSEIKFSESTKHLLKKLENNIEFVSLLKGRQLSSKSKKYLSDIQHALHQSISSYNKGKLIELLTAGWYGWIKSRYKEEYVIINECVSIASALATEISDQQ